MLGGLYGWTSLFQTVSNKPNKEIRYSQQIICFLEKTLGRGKRIGSAEGLRVVLLCRIRRGCLSKVLEVNKPCGVMKEACCGQREESSKVPSMRRPVVMEMASIAVVEGGKGRSGH